MTATAGLVLLRSSQFILQAVLIFVLLPTLLMQAAYAEDRWVTDEFEVMMRSGKTNKQRIIKQLKSGARLELLRTDDESGFSEVRVGSGDKGWVLTRYLRSSPTAKLRLPELEGRLERSTSQNKNLRSEIDALKKANQGLQRDLSEVQTSNNSLQGQVDRITKLSSNTIRVDEENQLLQQQLADSEVTVTALQSDNANLSRRSNREWFLVGGGVLVLGLLLGLILPRISWRKKDSWSDL
jgi:SH3 domain protein